MHDSKKKIYQEHGVISHVCKFIKCMKIIPTFKCFSTIFLSQTEANFTNLVKIKDTKVFIIVNFLHSVIYLVKNK